MSIKKITTVSSKETKVFSAEFAKQILQKKPHKSAIILALQGDLGSGKTTFIQGFAKGLGIKEKINSPTFVIMKRFVIPSQKIKNPMPTGRQEKSKIKMTNQGAKFRNLFHIDCYRLKDKKDLEVLEIKEIISNPENIVAIEWPEKISKILPKNIISIIFEHLEENKRELTIKR